MNFRVSIWYEDGKFFAEGGNRPYVIKEEGSSAKEAIDNLKSLLRRQIDQLPVDWVDFPNSGAILAYNIERKGYLLVRDK